MNRTRTASLLAMMLMAAMPCGNAAQQGSISPSPRSTAPPGQPARVLIATEKSTFKERLVAALVPHLEQRKLQVEVIDLPGLADVDASAWSAIVILHTWEFGMPPPAVREFVAQIRDPRRIIDITTSSSGHETMPGVDVISSASVVDEVPELVTQISRKIEALLTAD